MEVEIGSPDPSVCKTFQVHVLPKGGSGRGPLLPGGQTPKLEKHSIQISDDGKQIRHIYTRVNSQHATTAFREIQSEKRQAQREVDKIERFAKNEANKIKKRESKLIARGVKIGKKTSLSVKQAKETIMKTYRLHRKLGNDEMNAYILKYTNSFYPGLNEIQREAVYDETSTIVQKCPVNLKGLNKLRWVKGKCSKHVFCS